MDPITLPAHLHALDAAFGPLLDQLHDADVKRREALRVHELAYATAYIGADVPRSAESLRKQHAIAATTATAAELEKWDSEVRFVRDQLRVLQTRADIARSMWSAAKKASE